MAALNPRIAGNFQGRLFRKYAMYLAGLLSVALLASGLIGLFFSYRDTRALVDELEREKARAAASRIEQYIGAIEGQLRGALPLGRVSDSPDVESLYLELLKLLRLAPAVADAAWIDATGRERVRVSRVMRDVIGSNTDRSGESAFEAANPATAWHSPVYFRRETEPYLTMAVASSQRESGVVIADVNLKFVWDVVSAIRSGAQGHAYVVDSHGRLIAHPDISQVLRMTDLSTHPQVQAALADVPRDAAPAQTVIGRDDAGTHTLTAHAPIEALGWRVLVEQPLSQAFAPLYGSAARSALVLLLGIVLATVASIVLARSMAAPIRKLEAGAERIGDGTLDEPVIVRTGDELEDLASQFNRMTARLRESYAGLEQKIADRTRQLDEANRAKSRFLAAASHDLRQPVHALGLFVAQAQGTQEPAVRERLMTKVAASTAAVSELIEALLDISKLDAGTVDPQRSDFALQSVLDRIEHAFSPAASAKGLRLRVRPTRLRVTTDPVLLERILSNLAANAIRYTSEGGVLIGVRRRGPAARIEVWDTGVGIPREEQPRIFEEFYRIPGAGVQSSGGLGLGLAIVDRLTKLLDLTMSMRSAPGRGSVFAIEVALAESSVISIAPVLEPPVGVRFDGLCVLIVDDDAAARDAAAGLLAQWGCITLTAAGGAEVEGLLASSGPRPSVIVSDYRLGHAELGTDVVRHIRARLGHDVPALIVSADASTLSAEAIALTGMHLLHKPLKAANLRAMLHHVLSENVAREQTA